MIKAWLYSLLVAMVAILAPIQGALIAVGFLIATDTVCGMWAAHKQNSPITSRKFSRLISKVIFYNLAILSALAIEYLARKSYNSGSSRIFICLRSLFCIDYPFN